MTTKKFVDNHEEIRSMCNMPPVPPEPTKSELSLLRVLWQRGPCTVRQVMEALAEGGTEMGYTTVLKFLQIMNEKGLVKRNADERTHLYEAAMAADKMKRRLLGNVLDKVFAGSVGHLVMHALGTKKVSGDEIEAIRSLLDEIEKKNQKKS